MSFEIENGEVHAENVALSKIAEEVGTPFYCYSSSMIEGAYQTYADAFQGFPMQICFAVKANGNLSVLKTFQKLGGGADVVSMGEIKRALAADIDPSKIIFSGVGKTDEEISFALKTGISQINVESLEELRHIQAIAKSLGVIAPISLRVNPNIDAQTHAKINTGKKESKFGIEWENVPKAIQWAKTEDNIHLRGLSIHIGSQLTKLTPFENAFKKLAELVTDLKKQGVSIEHLDLGGGIGIAYKKGQSTISITEYAALIKDIFKDFSGSFAIEPGRSLVGKAGILVSKVTYVKKGIARNFVVLDAAMNDLARPSIYDAYHKISYVKETRANNALTKLDFVGPVCETADLFAAQRLLPIPETNELVILHDAGAYGATMSSEYNARPLIPEVFVKENQFAVIRPRPSYEEMLKRDTRAPWL
ncbi:MAG: diaminopimelate decarboxylase [Alphaproteobacteria bacterium]